MWLHKLILSLSKKKMNLPAFTMAKDAVQIRNAVMVQFAMRASFIRNIIAALNWRLNPFLPDTAQQRAKRTIRKCYAVTVLRVIPAYGMRAGRAAIKRTDL